MPPTFNVRSLLKATSFWGVREMAKGTLADMPPNIWKFAFHAELAVLHVNGSALNKDGSQDHCAKDASGGPKWQSGFA